jgi:TolA-binding protein
VRLALCGLLDGPRRLLERTGISRLFEIREGREDAVPLLPASRTRHDRIVEEQPKPKRRHRMLWTLLCLCVVVGAMTAIGTSAYPALQNYHAQLEQVPVLSGLLHGVDDRVQAVEQSLKDRFGNLEARLNGHLRNERLQRQRLQTEMDRRTAELSSRLEAVESAQRATDARITDLQQQVDQTKEGPQQ